MTEVVYKLIRIHQVSGNRGSTIPVLVSAPPDKVDKLIDEVVYDYPSGVPHKAEPDGSYCYEADGFVARLQETIDVPKEHFDVLKLYLTTITAYSNAPQNLENLG